MNIVFLGPSGVGKTRLAIGLGVRAIEKGFPVMYINASVLIERLKDAYQLGQLEWYLRILVRPKLLVVDEIGASLSIQRQHTVLPSDFQKI